MRNCLLATALFTLCALISTSAQQQSLARQTTSNNTPRSPQKEQEEVVRISVTLVQVDAVVTDSRGRQVTDLKPEDFEILEDGRRQRITNFSYIASPATTVSRKPDAPPEAGHPSLPPTRLRPGEVRRTIALVIDDVLMSFESIGQVRQALKRFVDEQTQPGDLVAIIRTAGGMGILQQFTSDKRVLYSAIERVRFNVMGRGYMGSVGPGTSTTAAPVIQSSQAGLAEGAKRLDAPGAFDGVRDELLTAGTLSAVASVVSSLGSLPGRKSVVLFSDGFQLFNQDDALANARVLEALRRLSDLANRSSVIVYTVDPRGVQPLQLTASDDVKGLTPAQILASVGRRRQSFWNAREGLQYLAGQTGGFMTSNSNDLAGAMSRILDDQRGYYLIGYVPSGETFKSRNGKDEFHQIAVKVKRRGLTIRSRKGFYSIADPDRRPEPETAANKLAAAIVSPFAADSIGIRMTALFGHDPGGGSYVRSLLHIDAQGISFREEPDGTYKAAVDLASFLFGDNGRVVDQQARNYTLSVSRNDYESLRRDGLIYSLQMPIKKPGGYQLRVAIHDTSTDKTGSANQFVDVPDIGSNRLALSGLVIGGRDPSKPQSAPIEPQANPAVRSLKQNMVLEYGFSIYNAGIDKSTNKPRLEVQAALYRDGKRVFAATPSAFEPASQSDWRQISAGGRLQLGPEFEPGEYALLIIVTDRLADQKYRAAAQSIDFEIVK